MNSVALVSDSPEQQAELSMLGTCRETELSEQWIFQGTDERGRTGWFLRLEVTGLYARRCGPFSTREEALDLLEGFLNDVLGAFCDVENELRTPEQAYLIEGAPRLAATAIGQ